jgi:hypothetical protein
LGLVRIVCHSLLNSVIHFSLGAPNIVANIIVTRMLRYID